MFRVLTAVSCFLHSVHASVGERLQTLGIFHRAVYSGGHIVEYHCTQWENHSSSTFVGKSFDISNISIVNAFHGV